MLFSATLDAGVDVIVKRFLTNPVTHSADSAQSQISTMSHHIFHVRADARLPVLVDLTSAPGRTMIFTRTKHGAKKLSKQLNASGIPTVELHGNLSQNARTRNMDAFQAGAASTLVATDIAARGIHVDDVNLVIHADPPVEHKAYLHRSGRTARAGAEGIVITLMTDDQVADVRDLTRKAGIKATTTRLDATHPLLKQLAPGERTSPSPSSSWRTRATRLGATVVGAVVAVVPVAHALVAHALVAHALVAGTAAEEARPATVQGAIRPLALGRRVAAQRVAPHSAPRVPSARRRRAAAVPAARAVRPRSTRRPRRVVALRRSPPAPASAAVAAVTTASHRRLTAALCARYQARPLGERLSHLRRVDIRQ